MANKKKKNQDTSPLALGRQQKGSAANKKANKTGSSNGSQSSSSNYSSRTSSSSSSSSSSSNQRSANTAANNNLKQNQIQRSQQQNRQLINRITESSNARRTAAQRQKITAGIDNSTNARKEREQRRLQAQAQKSGTNAINRPSEETRRASSRALKNTPKLVSKAIKDTISGHGQTIADVTELTAEKGTNAYAMKTGLSEKIAEADRKRAATEARKERKKMQAAQEARQAEWDELTKAAKGFEKAYYGAVESGTGMLTDLAIGGGTQLGALAAMGSRTYGQTRGQAEKEGATQSEDRRYALLQAAKEVGTELMFPGAGLAKKTYGKVGLPFAETLANAATKNLSGTAANVTRAGLKLAGGVAEENAEEFGGWLLDPLIKEYTYGKNVRERRRSELQRESDEWRSNILNDDDARSAAAYLNSSFIADNKKIYMDNGMSEGEAQKLAEAMRDYFTASLTGDTKKMEEIEDKLVGKGLSRKDWSLGELAETLAATTLLTGATGLPGTVMSSAQGAAFKGELGEDGIKALAKTAKDFEDKEMSLKAEVMADRIESGKEITDTEAYELKQGLAKQLQKDSQRETASVNSAMVKIQSQDLVSPLQSNANGEVLRGEVTEKAFKEENTKAKGAIKDVLKDNKESLTTKEINTGSRAIADFKVGTFDVNDANALNYSNKAVRTAFEESTGIDLEQYVVKNKDGSVNIPATNAATKDGLFAMAADNLVKSAQAETVYWMDTAKGEVVTQVSARMGASGSEALQQALDDVDEKDRSAYMMTANATDMLYQAARNMGIEWKDVASEATKMFPGIPESKLKMMYDAGLDDRKMAMDEARGRSVEMGKKLSEMSKKETATGKVFIDTNKPPLGTVIRTFTEIAKNLGADIHLTDAIKNVDGDAIDGANGAYDPDTNTFYLNVNTGMEKNIGYIFMHEVTHYIKRNAPEEYLALENLVREKWFQFNPEQMQDAIARKIEAYKKATKGKQVLTEEQALEEIIADAAHEFINDPKFAKQIADEDTGLAKAVLNSIRNALRMLRRIFASGSIDEETHMNSLFSELGILDEAEKIWLNAYTQAVKMRANQAINDWQDAVYAESDTRHSLADAHDYIINRKDSSARWTEERIDSLIKEYGASNPDYSQAYAVLMNPRDFLKLTLADVKLDKWNRYANEEEPAEIRGLSYDEATSYKESNPRNGYGFDAFTESVHALDEEELRNNEQTPFLTIQSKSGMEVQGHEGRHRMRALMERGIKSVPVVIKDADTKYTKAPTESMTLTAQDFGYDPVNNNASITIKDLVPIKESNRDELIQKFGGEADVRFSVTTDEEALPKGGALPKSLQKWAKEVGLDTLTKQPVKAPVIVSVKDLRTAWYEKNGRSEEAETINTALASISESLTNLVGEYQYIDLGDALNATVHYRTDSDGRPTSVILSCQVKNAEYEVNFDFTTICAKRLAMQKVLEKFIKMEGEQKDTLYDELKLDEEGMYKLRLILEQAGFEVSCRGCFVEQNRYSQQNQAKTIADDWNAALDAWAADNGVEITDNFDLVNMDINSLDYDEIDEGFKRYHELMKGQPANVENKNRALIEASPFFRRRMNSSDYASLSGQRALMAIGESKKGGTNLYGLLKRGQSDSKQSVPFTAYNGEVALLPDKMKGKSLYDYLISIGGARAQSASDFQIEFLYDYMQMVADLSARGLPMHMYTKVIELAELFGMTGIKINLSAMCDVDPALTGEYAGLKLVDGKYEYNISDQSIDYPKAVELQKKDGYSKNIGIIMVVLSKEHMLKSLDDENVRYIIGYHSSAMPVVVANMSQMGDATDYTKLNKTSKLSWRGQVLFEKAMQEAKGKTDLEKYKDALRILEEKIQQEVATKAKKPRRGNEYGSYMTPYKGNTADFNTYDDIQKTNDARKTADNYIEWCMKNDYIPMYFPFAFHENYYKCEVYDFNMYDNVTGEYAPMEGVKNIYPGLNMDAGETDTTEFMGRVSEMMGERNAFNEVQSAMYEPVIEQAKKELSFSITGDDYMDFDASGIDHSELTHRADASKSEAQIRDEAYMSAVNSGNMEEAQRLVDEAAKSAGYDTRAYHGTPTYGFTEFQEMPSAHGKLFGNGFYFTDSEEAAERFKVGITTGEGGVYNVFLKPGDDAFEFDWNNITYDGRKVRGATSKRHFIEYDIEKEPNRDVIVHNINDGSEHTSTVYVIKDASRIKSVDPVTYAEDGSVIPLSERFDPNNDDIRYSLPTQDSDNNILSDGQMEYFKNSQARDEQGRLVPMYHVTRTAGFTIFEPLLGYDETSISFSNDIDFALNYSSDDGNPDDWRTAYENRYGMEEVESDLDNEVIGHYKVYLNMENPLIVTDEMFDEMSIYEWPVYAKANGYDGVIHRDFDGFGADIYQVFSSSQIKDTRNLNPTEDPDIRWSITPDTEIKDSVMQRAENIDDIPLADPALEENRVRYSITVDEFRKRYVGSWNERERTFGLRLDEKSVEKHIIALMRHVMAESNTGKQYRADTLEDTMNYAKVMWYEMKAYKTDSFAKTAWKAAEKIVDDIDYNDELYVEYKGVRDYLQKRKIQIPEELMYDESFADFMRDNAGKMRFDTQGSSVEAVYKYLRKKYPTLFTEDLDHPVDMLLQIDYALALTDPYREAYTSEEYSDLVDSVATSLIDIVSEGKAYVSVADELTEKYEAKVKAMKVRHQEAIQKVREERNAITEAERQRANMWKERYNERIQKEKQDKTERREREDHKKKFARIEEKYNNLCKWVLEPTKDKNVPEEFRRSLAEFLQTLDLQTEKSKALEEKTGHVAQKTFKMRELKDRLKALATSKTDVEGNYTPSLFEVDENVAFILDKLADKLEKNGNTIDALDQNDINSIDVFMTLLIRNINRYKEVRKEEKTAELSAVRDECMDFFEAKIKRDGMATKRGGPLGALDTINATALTPPYLFERMGPFKEMYDVLRHNGFDTYIRNEAMIIDKITDILRPYYKGGKKPRPGSVIEDWRDDTMAKTFNLTHGPVTLSVAQMMSLYCLDKRGTQATDHMTCGGIYVTPIQVGSKIQAAKEKYIKGQNETPERLVLTPEDIKTILAELTPEQAKVASALQQLMSEDMARLGNIAHRDLYGYNNFNDPNYFPIKVHGNELSTDINNIGQVVEKIKSYGPAKPVTPGASNALVIDDIFSVVADHCNGMNLYNAYLVPITDFMKVLNSSRVKEDGTEQTMKDLIEQAYGKDMLTYIMNLMKDINGIKADNRGGLEGLMNKALGRAKKTAVFGNIRVALQQPTAIVRALAEMDVKYFTPLINVAPEKDIKEEMYKYCPIAQWKSWGYYDTYMGRDIEDVMMNNWSKMDVALSGIYGELDNWTWSLIWRAVKAETKAKHPEMDTKSEEFLQLCGRRASDVFDKTQVVDSTFHRSDAMRSKQVAVKLFTAFMAEPTLTLNVFRAGCYNASEEAKAGRIGKAMKIFNRAISVIVLQAAVVSAAQAFADAWRGKDPGWPWGDDDDDDEEKAGYWLRWQRNFLYNLFDQLHLENNMYLIKDITPYINYMISQAADYLDWNPTLRAVMGWDQDYLYSQNNLIFAGLENTANGVAQLFKKLEKGDEYVDYKTKEPKAWYDIIQKITSGIGTFIGFPVGTLMRDFRPIFMKLFPAVFAADSQLEETLTERFGKGRDGSKKSKDKEETKETSDKDEASDNEALKKLAEKAEKKAAGLSGDERNAMLWDVMSEGYTKHLDEADMDYIEHLELEFMNNGGDLDYFYEKLKQQLPSAYKKTLDDNMTDEDVANQWRMYMKMKQLGFTDEEVSDMCYRSYKAKDLKAALRMNNPQFIQDELSVLVQAGLSEEDFAKLYKYRNSGAKTYSGKYSDEKYKKSTGTYVWPAQGPITSEFGYRNAPTSGASTNHPAIDIGAAYGSPVCAADGGTIISVGWNGGYGNQIAIRHDNGTITYYSHLSGFNVNEGDTVTQGAQIGQVGSTGNSTGPHLDFKVEVNGEPVNPLQYLNTANAEYALDA